MDLHVSREVSPQKELASFTSRLEPIELDIINMLVNGKTNLAIASILHMDIKTLEHYINCIYKKVKTYSKTDVKLV